MKLLRKVKGFFYFTALKVKSRKFPEVTDYIDVNGMHLLYAVRGPEGGKPVVLLHGNGGSHFSMETQARELAIAGYRAYSLESRGQGANPVLEEYHYADMAEDAACFIEALGLEKPAVYGWSDGGIEALLIGRDHPDMLGLMAISGANLFPDCGPDFEEFKAYILSVGTPLALMMLDEPQIDPASLAAIKCPTLVTVGDEDLISVEHTHLISDNIPNAELVVVPKASHSSFIKKNPRMGRLLLDFFARHGYAPVAALLAGLLALSGCSRKPATEWYDTGREICSEYADVFYIASTNIAGLKDSLGNTLYNATLDDGQKATLAKEYSYAQSHFFPDSLNFFAPYYRQYTFETLVDLTEDEIAPYVAVAEEDIFNAFDEYYRKYNGGRPFVLAGFSQGGQLATALLKHMTDKQFSHCVATYSMGFKLTAEDLAYPHVVAATGATDLGVVVSYNTITTPESMYGFVAGNASACINPVNWCTDTTPGVLYYKGDTLTMTIDPVYNVVVAEDIDMDKYYKESLGDFFKKGNLHHYDIKFYAEPIRQNVLDRVRAAKAEKM